MSGRTRGRLTSAESLAESSSSMEGGAGNGAVKKVYFTSDMPRDWRRGSSALVIETVELGFMIKIEMVILGGGAS